MEVVYQPTPEQIYRNAFIHIQCNCPLCSTPLELQVIRTKENEVNEQAYCPVCQIRARSKLHNLH